MENSPVPKILLTNDDGWDAPGIATLKEVLESFGEVTTVAPATPQSGISHQMTFETPMTLTQFADRDWHLTGTPSDCARVGLTQLGVKFDWVFSGINNGGNLGVDYFVSGTVAAAREATFFGVRAVAISQHRLNYPEAFDWKSSGQLARRVVESLLQANPSQPETPAPETLPPGQLISVNLPDCSHRDLSAVKIVYCQRDDNPLPYDYVASESLPTESDPNFGQRGHSDDRNTIKSSHLTYCGTYNDRLREPGKDVAVCLGGDISITRG